MIRTRLLYTGVSMSPTRTIGLSYGAPTDRQPSRYAIDRSQYVESRSTPPACPGVVITHRPMRTPTSSTASPPFRDPTDASSPSPSGTRSHGTDADPCPDRRRGYERSRAGHYRGNARPRALERRPLGSSPRAPGSRPGSRSGARHQSLADRNICRRPSHEDNVVVSCRRSSGNVMSTPPSSCPRRPEQQLRDAPSCQPRSRYRRRKRRPTIAFRTGGRHRRPGRAVRLGAT